MKWLSLSLICLLFRFFRAFTNFILKSQSLRCVYLVENDQLVLDLLNFEIDLSKLFIKSYKR